MKVLQIVFLKRRAIKENSFWKDILQSHSLKKKKRKRYKQFDTNVRQIAKGQRKEVKIGLI